MKMSERLKYLRLKKGLTLEQVGDYVGVAKATVLRWENGQIRSIRRDKIAKLAQILDTSPDLLIDWESDQDEWTKAFCESVDEQLAMADSADIQDSGVNYSRLSEIASGVNNLSLSEACDIADELGCSLDAMVGKEPPEDNPSNRRLKEFIELFAQLTEEQQKMLIMQMKGLLSNE